MRTILSQWLLGLVMVAGIAAPSHAAVIFSFDATEPIQSYTGVVGIVNSSLVYDPATQGAITSLNFSIQSAIFDNFTPVPPANAAARAVIFQGGNYYTAQATGPFPGVGTFGTVSATGWTAANFGLFNLTNSTIVDALGTVLGPGEIDSSINPNFSASGAPIEFGTGGVFNFKCGTGGAANLTCPFQVQQSVERQDMTYTVFDPSTFTDINFADLNNFTIIDFISASDPAGAVIASVAVVPEPASILIFFVGLIAGPLLRRLITQSGQGLF
jgi:hypothetical protein